MMTSTIHSINPILSSVQRVISHKNVPSNSIIITSLPKIFFHPSLQLALRSHFDSYGQIIAWNLLPNVARILVVYSDPEPAVAARTEMDQFVFEESEIKELFLSLSDLNDRYHSETTELFNDLKRTTIRVYFGPKTYISTSTMDSQNKPEHFEERLEDEGAGDREVNDRLKPPSLEKNFLISPPGSPPVGWTQITEDAPNQNSLADDLCQRLRFLSVGDEEEAKENNNDEDNQQRPSQGNAIQSDGCQQPAALNEIIILPAQPARQLPALKVQPIQASLPSPGMNIHLVKETIESMLVSAGNKISPTPRPDIFSTAFRN
ncbi:hypothetical protein Pst134EA_017841 [Puccinia striiformis f. sp. tritici]|uniref:uncharacterized protein n=1 Tax=Puccinia striiformis f. sp. tritici TaxID=168172 RepID=UPI0020082013|nr:uncharacterized protein Pst134EA_031757 [Puccinia striiformis f. sp. tritici]XP_047804489.1 hypothetical protein Pst134EA_017841 [Puccinia striiformis f. sp. tritici]KAH9442599.1 hypothetical protein Pst134EA_031757 [Puccinia striiformis f. sp. tritici]KAH9461542.1 hypothetical protein Pst134EA_017841 [Puccinia striiformis f. sp. tritici]